MQQQLEQTHQTIASLEASLQLQQERQDATYKSLLARIDSLEEQHRVSLEENKEIPVSIKRVNDELFNTQLQFEEKINAKEREIDELTNHIHTLALEQIRLHDEVSTKENKAEAERIVKETEKLKDKNSHIETELKLANHKIEKMEILNEKAERLKAKKDLEIMKEI